MDKLTAAIQEVAEDYGYKRLAAAVGCPYQVLVNQCNPINDRPISLRKFWLMFSITKDMRLLVAFLDEVGAVAVAKGRRDDDATLFDLVINHQVAAGTVAQTVRDALADNRISAQERKEIRKAVRAEIDALTSLEAELEEMAEPRLAKA
ncbi:phage regulatory CII family protein [uncultured Halomonas sp.]|uniref:phage regulatory CII family protein n=1 Tax=uncultured Halomonas sp. TaxID=173971 RepID=UPI002598B97A|nr:phage regulatory CII family protein [uncultured Halomonas sp.]